MILELMSVAKRLGDGQMFESQQGSALHFDEVRIATVAHDLEDITPARGGVEAEVEIEFAMERLRGCVDGEKLFRDLSSFGGSELARGTRFNQHVSL